jgi:hypothetical protein
MPKAKTQPKAKAKTQPKVKAQPKPKAQPKLITPKSFASAAPKAKPKPRPATFEEMLKHNAETVAKHEPRFKRLEEQKKRDFNDYGKIQQAKADMVRRDKEHEQRIHKELQERAKDQKIVQQF